VTVTEERAQAGGDAPELPMIVSVDDHVVERLLIDLTGAPLFISRLFVDDADECPAGNPADRLREDKTAALVPAPGKLFRTANPLKERIETGK
jgi:hypothetical protein